MSRRISLAFALAFTTVVTFAVVVLGANSGVFSDAPKEDAAAGMEVHPTPAPPAVVAPGAAPAPAGEMTPQVIIEYQYVDVTVSAPAAVGPTRPAGAPPVTPTPATPAATQVDDGAPSPSPSPVAPAPPTVAPPSPTAPATATTAASATPAPKKELEFTGTVTSVSGDLVTFSYGGDKTVTVRVVTMSTSLLPTGTRAHVHALLLSDGYVAKEISVA